MSSFDLETAGRVHSVETLGAGDGPGLRMVVFLQGCPMACRYCHNPDTWDARGGRQMTVGELVRRAERMRPYWDSAPSGSKSRDEGVPPSGGVTLSGGEPLTQGLFAASLFGALKASGFSTALETSGFLPIGGLSGEPEQDGWLPALLALADLVILDVKSPDPESFQWLTGRDIRPLCLFLNALEKARRKTWIRQVMVPGWNDKPENLAELADFLSRWPGLWLEKAELLPYHTLGKSKWEKLGMPDPLPDVPPMDETKLAALQDQIDRLVFHDQEKQPD